MSDNRCIVCASKRATYGIVFGKPTHCKKCNVGGLQRAAGARCCKMCTKRPSFGIEPNTPLYCEEHKQEGMRNVIDIRCDKCGKTRASFGIEDKKPTRCKACMEPGMKNVISKTCEKCDKQPCYGYRHMKPERCAEHKLPDMTDVRSKKCEECPRGPSFGTEWGKPVRCAKHKLAGMYNVVQSTCEHEGCNTQPTFGFERYKPLRCRVHRLEGMENVKAKLCRNHDVCFSYANVTNDKYEGYCIRCFVHLFPDAPTTRNFKTKETTVAEFLRESFPDTTMVFDKQVEGGCSRKRPDVLIDMGSHVVIVEVDENQHGAYECEQKRMLQIVQDCQRDAVFVRVNPDAYVDERGVKRGGCFGICGQTRLCIVKDERAWKERMDALKEAVTAAMASPPERTLEVVDLFFDSVKTNE